MQHRADHVYLAGPLSPMPRTQQAHNKGFVEGAHGEGGQGAQGKAG